MYDILINVLIFCGIILLLVLAVAVVQGILILLDVRKMVYQVKEKVLMATSFFFSRSILTAAIAGIKKGFKVFFDKEEEKSDG